jgi:hypothetical protein
MAQPFLFRHLYTIKPVVTSCYVLDEEGHNWQLVSENSSSMKRISEMLVDRIPGNLSENVLASTILQISANNDPQQR